MDKGKEGQGMREWRGIVTRRGGFPWATMEATVAGRFERLGLRTWMPTESVSTRHHGQVQVPLIRGLVFVQAPVDWYEVKKVPGYIMPVYGAGQEPARITDAEIDAMRRVADGYRIQATTGTKLKPGDKVKIRLGAISDLEAIVQGIANGRPVVEYELLGKRHRQAMNEEALT